MSAIESGELVASLVTDTLPDALPPAVGANTTLSIVEDAAFNVKGVVIPFAVKPAPVTAIPEI